MTTEIVLLFVITTALACFTPGPAAIFVTSVGTARRVSLVTCAIAGIALVNVVFFLLSALGLASLLLASPAVYAVLRWIGAGYLIYLGIRLVFTRGASSVAAAGSEGSAESAAKVFVKGIAVQLSNPKALLYFSALLPQFITPSLPLAPQFAAFCLITVVLDVLAYTFYGALGFGIARFSARRVMIAVHRLAGVAFVAAGVRLVQAT